MLGEKDVMGDNRTKIPKEVVTTTLRQRQAIGDQGRHGGRSQYNMNTSCMFSPDLDKARHAFNSSYLDIRRRLLHNICF